MKYLILALVVSAALASPTGKIINGHDAERGQFPYQAIYKWTLTDILGYYCSATIVSAQFVVTAAMCVRNQPIIENVTISVGTLGWFEHPAERQDRNVTNIIIHPDYPGTAGPNDIAIIQLAAPLEWSEFVQPVALPAAGAVFSGNADVSGWGAVDNNETTQYPNILQTAQVSIWTHDECNTALDALLGPSQPYDNISNICTGSLVGNISVCWNDNGGPLVQDGVFVGLVSWWLVPCGYQGAPSVYTSVSSFIDFIREHVTDLP